MHTVCSPRCASKSVKTARKAEKAAYKRRQEAAKPRAQWLKEAQAAFNAYIRMRDAHLPCISCGRMHDGQWHAGHYLSTGARPELRFTEVNVWRQCSPCNTHLHGNLVLYRAELIRRIGLAGVERLEGPHPTRKYTVDDLREIRDTYRSKLKRREDLRQEPMQLDEAYWAVVYAEWLSELSHQ
jgi:hypothetical protein